MTEVRGVWLPPELWEAVLSAAAREDVRPNRLIRAAVEAYLAAVPARDPDPPAPGLPDGLVMGERGPELPNPRGKRATDYQPGRIY